MTNIATTPHWDIFCTVVDNYGDIGVTWRLARQLATEFKLPITLWVDDLASFQHILPRLDPNLTKQRFDDVNIHLWDQPLTEQWLPGDVIIESFACNLPQQVEQQIALLDTPPIWINLEYLTAESWVEDCHQLASISANGINKYFFFPGFTDKTGGLLCEHALFAQRDQWQSDNINKLNLFTTLGIKGIAATDTVISVFSYETEALNGLLDYWQQLHQTIHLLIPMGRSLNSIKTSLSLEQRTQLDNTKQLTLGNVTLHILPMTDQQGFDRLLWSCDINIVRGEDSFLRAQWAAKPMLWHIYQQEEDAHIVKLQAFMDKYCQDLDAHTAANWQSLNLAFNQNQPNLAVNYWDQIDFIDSSLSKHAQNWPVNALNHADLASRLVQFVKNS